MSDTDRVQLSFIAEDTFGELKTGSNLQILRFTSESLKQEMESRQSAEIRSDRQVTDVKRTRVRANGDISFELSYEAQDDFLNAALMSSDWSTPVTVGPATTISASDSDNSFNDSGNGFGSIVANQWVKTSGFSNAANNGYFKVVSAAAGKIVVSGGTLTTESAGQSVTIVMGAQIVNGTTCPSFNIERQYTDLSNTFAILTGMCVNQFSLNFAAGELITGSFSFLGSSEQSASASSGSGYDAAPTNEIMASPDEGNEILENQAAYAITSFSMQLMNNLRDKMVVGSENILSIGTGKINLSGTVQAYFESSTAMDKFLNQTASSLAIALEDSDGNAYVIDMPQVKYTSGQRPAMGENQDVIADLGFTAYMDASEGITIRIAKFAA